MDIVNQEVKYNFSEKHFKTKVLKNVKNYYIDEQSIIINLDLNEIEIISSKSDIDLKRKLPKWQSAIFTDSVIKEADSVIIIKDKTFKSPDFKNNNLKDFTLLDENYFVDEQSKNLEIRNEIISGKWENVSILYENLKGMYLWKTKEENIKILNGYKFDPYYALGLSKNNEKTREIEFTLKNYIWFTPKQTHCGIHNQHSFIEFHTQLYGVGRMLKFTSNNTNSIFEDQRLLAGSSQSHTYCNIKEIDTENNMLQLSYPWHEYYSDTDCVWLVTELNPKGSE